MGECDLGMVKLVVPILEGDEVVGFIGACGAREPDVQLETLLASHRLEVDEESLQAPAATVGVISPETLQRAVTVIQEKLQAL